MTETTFIGYLVGGLASLLGLYFLVEKFKEKDQKKLEAITEKLEKMSEDKNDSQKELTKAIHELTTTVKIMNNNMISLRKDLDDVDLGVEKFKDEIREELVEMRKSITNIKLKCAEEHGSKRKIE